MIDTPLWAFSLAVYGADGVAAECLDVQDRFGIDVNLLLFAAYAGAVDGVALGEHDVAAAVAATSAWHADIVRPLRGARRGLKPASRDETNSLRTAVADLRAWVKAAELEAEKIEQAMLWSWWRQSARVSCADAQAALDANLDVLLAHYGAPAESIALKSLKAAAMTFAASKS